MPRRTELTLSKSNVGHFYIHWSSPSYRKATHIHCKLAEALMAVGASISGTTTPTQSTCTSATPTSPHRPSTQNTAPGSCTACCNFYATRKPPTRTPSVCAAAPGSTNCRPFWLCSPRHGAHHLSLATIRAARPAIGASIWTTGALFTDIMVRQWPARLRLW